LQAHAAKFKLTKTFKVLKGPWVNCPRLDEYVFGVVVGIARSMEEASEMEVIQFASNSRVYFPNEFVFLLALPNQEYDFFIP
jgi:hypothetical protein